MFAHVSVGVNSSLSSIFMLDLAPLPEEPVVIGLQALGQFLENFPRFAWCHRWANARLLAFAGQHRNELERFITKTKIYLTASCHLTRFWLLVILSKSVQFFSLRFMCILVISLLAFLAATMPAEQWVQLRGILCIWYQRPLFICTVSHKPTLQKCLCSKVRGNSVCQRDGQASFSQTCLGSNSNPAAATQSLH